MRRRFGSGKSEPAEGLDLEADCTSVVESVLVSTGALAGAGFFFLTTTPLRDLFLSFLATDAVAGLGGAEVVDEGSRGGLAADLAATALF
jgi:hypothetical protein